eukprot:3941758-Rhodomonas_salina.4
MSGTRIAHAAMQCATEIAYAAMDMVLCVVRYRARECCYAECGNELGCSAAECGTELAYLPMRRDEALVLEQALREAKVLSLAMSGTEIAYDARRRAGGQGRGGYAMCAVCSTDMAYSAKRCATMLLPGARGRIGCRPTPGRLVQACYAMSGIDVAYGAPRHVVLRKGRVIVSSTEKG